MIDRHVKGQSAWLSAGETEIKTTMRALHKDENGQHERPTEDKCWRELEKRDPSYTVGGDAQIGELWRTIGSFLKTSHCSISYNS